METGRTYHVKQVAALTGVSVRTLHHYHDIGLLTPAALTGAGYRLYDDANLVRLQQILIRRAMGFALADIRRVLDDPAFDARAALRAQKAELQDRAAETARMIKAIDRALAIIEGQRKDKDMSSIFDGFDPAQYEQEAEQRWGATDAYKESAKRTRRYTAGDWKKIKAEQAGIYQATWAVLVAGGAPEDPAALGAADAHRRFIDRWFYPCGPEMHKGLADMWEADPRFAENIDKFGAGLTPFLAAAVRANAARLKA